MPAKTLKTFHDKLVHTLVEMDKAESRRERQPNIYRMGHLLKAAEEAHTDAEKKIATQADVQRAFVDGVMANFNPSRRLRTFLKKIDPSVDVDHGRWVRK